MSEEKRSILNTKITGVLFYVLSIHFLAILFMAIFRFVLLKNTQDFFSGEALSINEIYKTVFLKGFRFDNLIASYISFLPLVILSILAFTDRLTKTAIKLTGIYYIILYTLVFALSAANIPYFEYFFRHINLSILNWMEFGGDASMMILQEKSYWIYFAIFILSVLLIGFLVVKIGRWISPYKRRTVIKKDLIITVPAFLLVVIMCIFGIRGNIRQKETLQINYAFFCGNSILNQLPINPVFFFVKSSATTSQELMDTGQAVAIAEKELGFSIKNNQYNIPFTIEKPQDVSTPNIVIVFMESLSDGYLHIERNGKPITPFINSLIEKSYYFDRFFSQGIHTNQGIAATLFGFPAILDFHMFKAYILNEISSKVIYIGGVESQQEELIPHYYGLPYDLKNYGYENMFFLTHVPTFDNAGNFFKENGFEEIFSQDSYPPSEIVNKWGISDKDLYKHAIEQFDKKYDNGKLFFAAIQTISNHPPYYYTDEFNDRSTDISERSMAYGDWCLNYLIEESSKKEWFDNTIFVILGDHGKAMTNTEKSTELSLNHVPLIIYSPLFEDVPRRINDLGGQIDIYATLMGLIDIPASYKSFGVDLLKNKREYIYFSTDDKISCLNNTYRYTYDLSSKTEALYDYTVNDNSNRVEEQPSVADSMKTYSFAMIESAKYIMKNKLARQK